MTRLMISCGEPSGDLYAGALVAALRRREPDLEVFGLGGEQLKAAGGELIADFHGLSVTGLTEALAVLPRSWRTLRLLTEAAKTGPGKGVVSKLPEMLPKYYEVRGWNPDGTVKPETRERLGL